MHRICLHCLSSNLGAITKHYSISKTDQFGTAQPIRSRWHAATLYLFTAKNNRLSFNITGTGPW